MFNKKEVNKHTGGSMQQISIMIGNCQVVERKGRDRKAISVLTILRTYENPHIGKPITK